MTVDLIVSSKASITVDFLSRQKLLMENTQWTVLTLVGWFFGGLFYLAMNH